MQNNRSERCQRGVNPVGKIRRRMMMRLGKLFMAAAAVGATATAAQAAITATWVPVAINAAAIAHDPQLATKQSWDLRVTTDGNWASAGMRVILPAGQTFYKNALGSNTKPNPAFITIAPSLEFTTYVTAPGDTGSQGAPSVL